MPDTHDERGGDADDRIGRIAERIEAALYELRGLHGANRAKRGIAGAVADLRDAADEVRQQLAAATARAEKAEAERDETRVLLYRIIGAVEHACALNTYVELEPGEVAPTVESLWVEVREIRGVTADAAQDGLSGSVEPSEASGGAFHGNTSSITPRGLSEPEPPRDPSAWCWAPNPAGRLHCGRPHGHEPPHQRGERTWTSDDTMEAGR